MVILQEPQQADREMFIAAMQASQLLHHPWVNPPKTAKSFEAYFLRYQQDNQKSYWVIEEASGALVGVFNLNEIVRGLFQNAFMGYYAVSPHQGKGYMSAGLKLVFVFFVHDWKSSYTKALDILSHSRLDKPSAAATSRHCFTAEATSLMMDNASSLFNLKSFATRIAVSKEAVLS